MGWVSDLAAQLRRIMLMDEKVEQLRIGMAEVRRDVRDVDRRVMVIEALIEAAERGRRLEY